MDFEKFFEGLVKLGVPHPRSNPEFRAGLIDALVEMDMEEAHPVTKEKDDFEFSEIILKNKNDLLYSRYTSSAMLNRVADWFITAYEKGYIKSSKKEQDVD